MEGLTGAPGQGVPAETFYLQPRYEQAKGFACAGSSDLAHTWSPQKQCAPGGAIDLSFKFTTPHGGILRAFMCAVGAGTPHHASFESNTHLTDSVFDDCWRELEYAPPSGSPDAHLEYWYVDLGEQHAITGRYSLPSDIPEGHTLIMLQWATSNSFYPKRFKELRTKDPALWDALTKNMNNVDAEATCISSSSCM